MPKGEGAQAIRLKTSAHTLIGVAGPNTGEAQSLKTSAHTLIGVAGPNAGEASGSGLNKVLYESLIKDRHISQPDPQDRPFLDQCANYLRNMIARIHPSTPNLLANFTRSANNLLNFVAEVGITEDDMRFLESVCRATECILRQMESLSIVKTRISVSDCQNNVALCEMAADHARKEFLQCERAVKRQLERSSELTAELSCLSSRASEIYQEFERRSSATATDDEISSPEMDSLYQEHKELTRDRVRLKKEMNKLTRISSRGQERHQALQSTLLEAEAALLKAIKDLQTAYDDYDLLMTFMKQLRDVCNLFA